MGDRENKAMKDILHGIDPERRIIVAASDNTKEIREERIKKQKEQSNLASEKLEVMKEAFTCSKCGMDVRWGNRLDRKMQSKTGKCFNCIVEEETKMRAEGTYEQYEKRKILQNKLSMAKEQRQGIIEFKEMPMPTFLNKVGEENVEKEKWNGNTEMYKKLAEDALVEIDKIIDEIEQELQK